MTAQSLQDLPGHLIRRLQQIAVSAFATELERAGSDLTPVQYAALHTLVYVIDRGTLDRIIEALPETFIWTGWLAMLIFVPLGLTSNNAAQRWLHSGWKTLQRAAYPAAVLVLIHWASLHDWGGWQAPAIHFAPLVGLWAYRLWYWYLRPRAPLAPA